MASAAQRTAAAAAIATFAALLFACLRPQVYACETAAACVIDDKQGSCVAGYCAYPDAECPSTLRFGPSAGDGMAGECVPDGSGTETDPTIAASSEAATGGCGACDTPPDPCHLPAGTCEGGECKYPFAPSGTDCAGDDPCTIVATCDGAGECVVVDETVCDDPPGPCHAQPGTCLGPDDCHYDPKERGEPCEDGDDCTLEDTCNGAGVCSSGGICPTDNPCAVGNCGGTGQCSFFPVTDGTPCGALPVDVCCGGACVNLELDEANCGGCDVACQPTQQCTADPTPMCTP